MYKIALAGNPNCGKTTLFNYLTKLNQTVGNWAGVTVEKKEGIYFGDKSISIIDLPGIYSLSPFSPEEDVTRGYLMKEPPDLIINVVDATKAERSLFLTTQLLELNIKTVIALNMADEYEKTGAPPFDSRLSEAVGAPTISISALKGKNVGLLMDTVIKLCKITPSPVRPILSFSDDRSRHAYIKNLLAKQGRYRKKPSVTEKLDRLLTNRFLAFPFFFAIIFVMYFTAIQGVGGFLKRATEDSFSALSSLSEPLFIRIGLHPYLTDFLLRGLLGGIGTVLSFLPQLAVLFFFLTLLEASGYMARAALIFDRLFKHFGLSGKAFFPLLIGCGCSVPAIMSAKTLENVGERKLMIALCPFVPCSAKLPVFSLLAGCFFPNNPFVAPSMYLVGICVILISAILLSKAPTFRGAEESFLLELPPYRLPPPKYVGLAVWTKLRLFLKKTAVTVISASVLLWLTVRLTPSFQYTEGLENSIVATVGRWLSPLFYPLGFGDFRVVSPLLVGSFGKEAIVSSLGIILGDPNLISEVLSPAAAYSYMLFILLSFPCTAALGTVKQEMCSSKALLLIMLFQFSVAYAISFFFYTLFSAANLLL